MRRTNRRAALALCSILAVATAAHADDRTTWDAGECGVKLSIPSGVTVSARRDGNLYKARTTPTCSAS